MAEESYGASNWVAHQSVCGPACCRSSRSTRILTFRTVPWCRRTLRVLCAPRSGRPVTRARPDATPPRRDGVECEKLTRRQRRTVDAAEEGGCPPRGPRCRRRQGPVAEAKGQWRAGGPVRSGRRAPSRDAGASSRRRSSAWCVRSAREPRPVPTHVAGRHRPRRGSVQAQVDPAGFEGRAEIKEAFQTRQAESARRARRAPAATRPWPCTPGSRVAAGGEQVAQGEAGRLRTKSSPGTSRTRSR